MTQQASTIVTLPFARECQSVLRSDFYVLCSDHIDEGLWAPTRDTQTNKSRSTSAFIGSDFGGLYISINEFTTQREEGGVHLPLSERAGSA